MFLLPHHLYCGPDLHPTILDGIVQRRPDAPQVSVDRLWRRATGGTDLLEPVDVRDRDVIQIDIVQSLAEKSERKDILFYSPLRHPDAVFLVKPDEFRYAQQSDTSDYRELPCGPKSDGLLENLSGIRLIPCVERLALATGIFHVPDPALRIKPHEAFINEPRS